MYMIIKFMYLKIFFTDIRCIEVVFSLECFLIMIAQKHGHFRQRFLNFIVLPL